MSVYPYPYTRSRQSQSQSTRVLRPDMSSTFVLVLASLALLLLSLVLADPVPAAHVVPVPSVSVPFPFAMMAYDNLLMHGGGMTLAKQSKPDCPYCDSSVFPYCSDKLLHDACCCLNPYDSGLPAQCQLADCSFLHANTCKEHRLITRCCCDRLLYIKR